ncbi:MAG: inner membrane CreD family protein [Candidatus Hydrogenedentes bacterium]|nr:inner membrane CreD family protein [Candidatus Hydrogenedentota bacterium]
MNASKIAAILLILAAASAAWWVLGSSMHQRTQQSASDMGASVASSWGAPLTQNAPTFSVAVPGSDQVRWILPVENTVTVSLDADYRRKGLLWFPTYVCAFSGRYTVSNDEAVAQKLRFHFAFPTPDGTYDAFQMAINGTPYTQPLKIAEGVDEFVELQPGESAEVSVAYTTRGLGTWWYRPAPQTGRVQQLALTVNTNFRDVDYPESSLSPARAEDSAEGKTLTWQATDLITSASIGVVVPELLNPGPLTARIIFFAPFCLVFFFVLVAAINIVYRVNIHPMHYLFVAAGFFAFHLLLAYLADLVPIHGAFMISAAVSVFLVTTYLSAALKGAFPWKIAAAGQLLYLVLFSYSFFLEGLSGLTIAVGSVITLAILMRVTAHLNWEEVFAREAKHAARNTNPLAHTTPETTTD